MFAGIGLAALLNVDGFTVAKRLFEDQSLAEQTLVTLSREQLQEYVKQADIDKDPQVRIDDAKVILVKIGLPMGDRYFPRCGKAADGTYIDARCPGWETGWIPKNAEACLSWILSIIVTGALLGLGSADYSAKAVRSLTLPRPRPGTDGFASHQDSFSANILQ